MWGLQEFCTAKERDNHSHHCIDAIVIACIDYSEYNQWARYVVDEENTIYHLRQDQNFPSHGRLLRKM